MILVDTSVWIEVIRSGSRLRPGSMFDLDETVTCLPIIQEVLQGIGDEALFRLAREAMFSLPIVESPLTRETHERAIELYRLARRQGMTIRSSVDCLIAACALRHDLTVLHRDRDYASLAKVSGLRERRV